MYLLKATTSTIRLLLLLLDTFSEKESDQKNILQKSFKGSETTWNKFVRPAHSKASHSVGMAV